MNSGGHLIFLVLVIWGHDLFVVPEQLIFNTGNTRSRFILMPQYKGASLILLPLTIYLGYLEQRDHHLFLGGNFPFTGPLFP